MGSFINCMVKPSSWLIRFLRSKGNSVKKKGMKVQFGKRTNDPTGRASRREDYGYQQLKDFRLRTFQSPRQRLKGGH
jgi:hypothetical protein